MFSKMKLIVLTDDEVEYANISKFLDPLDAFERYNSNDIKTNIENYDFVIYDLDLFKEYFFGQNLYKDTYKKCDRTRKIYMGGKERLNAFKEIEEEILLPKPIVKLNLIESLYLAIERNVEEFVLSS